MSTACVSPPNLLPGDPDICSGRSLSGQNLYSYWCTHDCPGTFSTILNTKPDGSLGYNPARLPEVQADMTSLFNNYLNTNIFTDAVGDPGYNTFQFTILNTCLDKRLPGVCDSFLKNYCTSITSDRITSSPIQSDFCGCYVVDPVLLENGVPNSCMPSCHRVETVQPADQLPCNSNTCVINDVSITLTKASIGNSAITFSQVCPGCSQSSCVCIISGVNVSQTMLDVGIGTQYSQLCGENSMCLQLTGNGATSVPCSSVNPNTQPIPTFSSKISILIIIIVVIIGIIIILALIATKFPNRKTIVPKTLITYDVQPVSVPVL